MKMAAGSAYAVLRKSEKRSRPECSRVRHCHSHASVASVNFSASV